MFLPAAKGQVCSALQSVVAQGGMLSRYAQLFDYHGQNTYPLQEILVLHFFNEGTLQAKATFATL